MQSYNNLGPAKPRILQEAQKIQQKNRRLEREKRRLEQQNNRAEQERAIWKAREEESNKNPQLARTIQVYYGKTPRALQGANPRL